MKLRILSPVSPAESIQGNNITAIESKYVFIFVTFITIYIFSLQQAELYILIVQHICISYHKIKINPNK